MSLQPPKESSYLVVPQTFFPSSHFHYQNHNQIQPYFVIPQLQTYVCNPFYYVFPSHHPFPNVQRPPNPPLNPRLPPPPPKNTRSRPKRNLASTTSRRRRKWVPKRKEEQASTSVSSGIPFPKSLHLQITPGTTTFMIKNIPYHFGRNDLLDVLKDYCLNENIKTVLRCEPAKKSEFDFLYLPMDFNKFWENKRIANLGYAFVNFTSSDAAHRFCKQYHNFEWPVTKNKKICEITRAETQGKEALERRFKNKIFWCHSNEFLPVILAPPCDGVKNSGLVTVGELAEKPKIYMKK